MKNLIKETAKEVDSEAAGAPQEDTVASNDEDDNDNTQDKQNENDLINQKKDRK